MSSIEEARQRWIKERPEHIRFGLALENRLQVFLRKLGLWFEVSARAKEVDSLVKKLLRKEGHSYESLPDKLGVRITVRYRADIPKIIGAVKAELDYEGEDDKIQHLEFDRVGYLSIHLDRLRLRTNDSEAEQFPPTNFWAELQVRTLAQHLWSEMSHDTIYKDVELFRNLSPDFRRRVHLMAGQLEVADREFDRLNVELDRPVEAQLFKVLESHYYRFASERPDVDLTCFHYTMGRLVISRSILIGF